MTDEKSIRISPVLFCIPVLNLGGSEIHLLRLVKVLRENGLIVEICVYHEWNQGIVDCFRKTGAEVIRLNWPRPQNIVQMILFCLKMRAFLSEYRNSIVHVQYLAPALLVILAARLAKVRTLLATVQVSGAAYASRRFHWMLRAAAFLCSAFFAVSRDTESFWFGSAAEWDPALARRGRRHFTIYNAVDVDLTASTAEEPLLEERNPSGEIRIGFVGRMVPQKGVDLLIRAWPAVRERFPRGRLHMVGEGSHAAEYQQLARDLGIHPFIHWVGALPPDRIPSFMGGLDLLVVPSRWEGFGLVAAEAMAAGVAVVASRVDGLAEVVHNGECGVFVPPENPQALAEAIVSLLENPERRGRMGKQGRNIVRERFSPERFRHEWISVYQYFQLR